MPSSIERLVAAGFDVQLAAGSVEAELAELDAARELAQPAAIEATAVEASEQAAADALKVAAADPRLEPEQVIGYVQEVTARVMEQTARALTAGRDAAVEHAEASLAAASAMPNTWTVSAPGLHLWLVTDALGEPLDDDGAHLVESLLDPAAQAGRDFDREAPGDVADAVSLARRKGYEVVPERAGAGWRVHLTGPGVDEAVAASGFATRAAALPWTTRLTGPVE